MGINKNFVVRNGLEVADNLLYVSDETNRVGVNTAIPEYELEVIGDTKLDGAIVSAADTSGVTGQYLKSTGEGWDWDTFPRSRQAERITLTAGQTRVPATGQFPSFTLVEYELTSVYLDGVKLTEGDYAINPGGDSITLFAAAFGGEEIEIIAHGATSVGTGNTGILGITARRSGIATGDPGRVTIIDFVGLGVTLDGRSGLVTAYIDSGGLTDVESDPAPLLGGYLGLNNRGIYGTGIITATGFVGDGSELTGITTLIKAGSNVNVTTFNGITTIGANVPEGQGFFSDDQTNAGIHTSATHVGLGTTNPRFQVEVGPVGSAGTQLWVNGDARITGILTVGSSSITIDGINDEIRIGTSLTITSDGGAQYSGIVTANGFDGDLVGQHKIFTAGVNNSDDYDIAFFLDPSQGGHSFARYDLGKKLQYNPSTGQLSNVGIISATGVIISGVSTFTSNVNHQGDINLGDNNTLSIGSGNDLQLYHDGSNSYIDDSGDGDIIIRGNAAVRIRRYTTEEMGVFNANGSVELYYDSVKKFETLGTGATITGTLFATDINTGIGTLSEVHTGTITAQGLDNLVLSADNVNRYVQAEGIILNKSRQIYGSGGDIRILGGGGQTSRPNLYLGNGNQCILDAGSGSTFGLSLKGGGSNGTVRVDEGDFLVGGNIALNRSTGIVSATSFVGDGSGLTGVTAVGSGIEIKDNDSLVGVAATINFGPNLSVTAISGGICTITGTDTDTGILAVVEDTTPDLGGNLNLNGKDIFGAGDIDIIGNLNIGVVSFTSGIVTTSISVASTVDITASGINAPSGIITAFSFIGDGSGLSGITAGYFDNNQTNPGIHTTAAHVGLGTTNPRTPLQVEEIYGVYTDYGNFSATAGVTTDGDASWTIATDDFKTAEYTLWFQYNENIQSQKVLVMNDGTTAYSQEYAIMFNNDLLVSVGATISAGVCKLLWTPETGVTGIVTYRVVRETML